MDIIINLFKEHPIAMTFLVIAIIGYFILSEKQKKAHGQKSSKELQAMTPEERAEYKKQQKEYEIERTRKIKNNVSVHTANVYDERHYESAPKDGTSIHQVGNSSVSYKNTKKGANAKKRLADYEHYLNDVREKNLNHLARNMEIINNECADDIYYLQKLGYFKNVQIDESNCRILYTDQGSNQDFITEDEMNSFEQLGNENPYEILKTDFEGEHVPGVNITHVCPHCGTPNIIDSNTSEYNCYYCLDKVVVKGKNRK